MRRAMASGARVMLPSSGKGLIDKVWHQIRPNFKDLSVDAYLLVAWAALFPIIPYLLLRAARVNVWQISPISIFFIYYLIVSYSGILPLYFYQSGYYANILRMLDREIFVQMFWLSSLSLLFVTLAIFVLSQFRGIRDLKYINVPKGIGETRSTFMLLVFALSVLVLFKYVRTVGTMPIQVALTGGTAKSIGVARKMATVEFSGSLPIHYYSLFYSTLIPFMSFIFCGNFFRKPTTENFIFAACSFLVAIFASIMLAEKAPLIWYLLGLGLVYLINSGRKISLAHVLLGGVGLVIVAGLLIKFLMLNDRSVSVEDLAFLVYKRVSLGSIAPAYWYVKMFPFEVNFLEGASFPNPRGFFPWEPYPITVEVVKQMIPETIRSKASTSAPAVFWAELYANFGYLGVAVGSSIVGAFLFILNKTLSFLPRGSVQVALLVWLSLHYMKLCEANFSKFLLDEKMVFVVAVGLLLILSQIGRVARMQELDIKKGQGNG